MKTLSLLLFLLFTNTALANTPAYNIKMDLYVKGKHVTTTNVSALAGKVARTEHKSGNGGTFIEVLANEGSAQDHNGIMMKFAIGTIDQNGKKVLLSKPQILANENEPAAISIKDKNGDEVALAVIAQRKK